MWPKNFQRPVGGDCVAVQGKRAKRRETFEWKYSDSVAENCIDQDGHRRLGEFRSSSIRWTRMGRSVEPDVQSTALLPVKRNGMPWLTKANISLNYTRNGRGPGTPTWITPLVIGWRAKKLSPTLTIWQRQLEYENNNKRGGLEIPKVRTFEECWVWGTR